MGPVSTRPRIRAIGEMHRIRIAATRRDDKHIRQRRIDVQGLGAGIDGRLGNLSDLLGGAVEEGDVEGVVAADAVFVALVLVDVEGAPTGGEAGRRGGGAGFEVAAGVGVGVESVVVHGPEVCDAGVGFQGRFFDGDPEGVGLCCESG